MKRFFALTAIMILTPTPSSQGFGQEGSPDPAINSRFVGTINALVTGSGQNQTFELESILEFRERPTGMLIGYARATDKRQNNKLVIDYWAQGQRQNAQIELNIPNPNPACEDIKLRGVLDVSGSISIPKTAQQLNCKILFGISINVATDATVLQRASETVWPFWKSTIEPHFPTK
jgi:hypothetical protein